MCWEDTDSMESCWSKGLGSITIETPSNVMAVMYFQNMHSETVGAKGRMSGQYLGVDSVEHCLGVAEPLPGRVHKLRADEGRDRVDSCLAANSEALCATGQARKGECLRICEGCLQANGGVRVRSEVTCAGAKA